MPTRVETVSPVPTTALADKKKKKKTITTQQGASHLPPPTQVFAQKNGKRKNTLPILCLNPQTVEAILSRRKRMLVSTQLEPSVLSRKIFLAAPIPTDPTRCQVHALIQLNPPVPFDPASSPARILARFHRLTGLTGRMKAFAYPVWVVRRVEPPRQAKLASRPLISVFSKLEKDAVEKDGSPNLAFAFVFTANGEVLLTKREPEGKWMPPGGHILDRHPATAAIEEAESVLGSELIPLGSIPTVFDLDGSPAAGFVFMVKMPGSEELQGGENTCFFSLGEIAAHEGIGLPLHVFLLAARLLARPTVDFAKLEHRAETMSLDELNETILWLHVLGMTESNLYAIATEELSRRGLKPPAFDEITKSEFDWQTALRQLPNELVVVNNWIAISGSAVYPERETPPKDLDVIIREPAPPPGATLKLQRAFEKVAPVPIHFSIDPGGPSWDFVPVYDLVARRRDPDKSELVRVEEDRTLYKGLPARFTRLFVPFAHYKAAAEFYPRTIDELEDWALETISERGPLAIQKKYDGIRMCIHFSSARGLRVFTESGRDRASVFPNLEPLLRTLGVSSIVLDTEFVEFTENELPKARWEMAWMVSADEPPTGARVMVFAHDLVFLNNRNLSERPYSQRLAQLSRILPQRIYKENTSLECVETRFVDDLDELRSALQWARGAPDSEGAMLKSADFRYSGSRLAEIAKLKNAVEIKARVIGWKKNPAPRASGKPLSRTDALAGYREAIERSRTYIFRCAILDRDRLIPIESDRTLTNRDLHLDWDEAKQRWIGTEDPQVWVMCPDFPERRRGEYAYGNTYALALPAPPRCGDVITVAPLQFRAFRKKDGELGYSWMFPRVVAIEPAGTPVSQLQQVLHDFGLINPHSKQGGHDLSHLLTPPPEDGTYRFVVQHHARGRSIHADLRLEFNDHLIGWTLFDQIQGSVDEPVTSLEQLKTLEGQPDFWKIDWNTGRLKSRKLASGSLRRISIRVVPKAREIPADWLNVEGVTETPDPGDPPPVGGTRRYPGVFSIVDRGTVEYGSAKPWFFEYFFHGTKLRGRYIIRLVEARTQDHDQDAADALRPYILLLIQPDDQRPYVLSPDAVKEDFLPPPGYSALPKRLREKIPHRLRYWDEKDRDRALAARRELAEHFEEIGGPDLIRSEDNRD